MGTSHASEIERAATAALDASHAALGAAPPRAASARFDGRGLLLVIRGACVTGSALTWLAHSVATGVYVRTGVLLSPRGVSADARRDLAVIAFEPVDSGLRAPAAGARREPLAGSN